MHRCTDTFNTTLGELSLSSDNLQDVRETDFKENIPDIYYTLKCL